MFAFFMSFGKVFFSIHLLTNTVICLTSFTLIFLIKCAGISSYPAAFLPERDLTIFPISQELTNQPQEPHELASASLGHHEHL